MKPLDQITENVVDLVSQEGFQERLATGKPLRIKWGADPSAPDLHLGHYVILRKLRVFQELGHQIVFVIGDFTGMIGDPTGKSETRKAFTFEAIRENATTYAKQVFQVLDEKKTEVRYNSEWLEKLSLADVIRLASSITVARMLDRNDFAGRFEQETPISLHEFLYPLIQGYDSVAIEADVEVGGTDQMFNLMVGRDLQKQAGMRQQLVLTLPILPGLDGVQKMSKSLGNAVGLTEPAGEMYGKVMSISDALMEPYYRLLSSKSAQEVTQLIAQIRSGKTHPLAAKKDLAQQLTTTFHGAEAARAAALQFSKVIQQKELPDEMPTITLPRTVSKLPLVELLLQAGLAKSKGEARRLIAQRGVRVDEVTVDQEQANIALDHDVILNVGKRKFAKVCRLS